jgi:hypothetical protein
MAKQTINIGSAADDGTGDPLRTAFDKANDNFDEMYTSQYIDVVRDYGADPTGSVDAATAIQNAVDAAGAATTGLTSTVVFPYGRYKLGSTIDLPSNVNLLGAGPDSSGNEITRIQWSGGASTMFTSDGFGAGTNHRGYVQNLHIHGNNAATNHFILNRLDLPTGFMMNCMLTDTAEHSIILQRGCTNAMFLFTRWDFVEGYMVCCQDGTSNTESTQNLNFYACTGTIGTTGNSGLGQGFIFLDNEAGGSMQNTININGLVFELNADPEDWEVTQGNRDVALIAVGHNATYATNIGRYQTTIMSQCVSLNYGSNTYDTAYIKLGTSDGNPADYIEANFIQCAANNAGSTFDWIDNTDTTFAADTDGVFFIPFASFCPYDGNAPGATTRKSYFDTRVEFTGGGGGRHLVIPTATSSPSFAQKSGMMYFNDSTDTLYIYNGTGWVSTTLT